MTEALIHRCAACARYTLAENCPNCGGAARSPHPPRFDPTDRYGVYRRRLLASVRATEAGA